MVTGNVMATPEAASKKSKLVLGQFLQEPEAEASSNVVGQTCQYFFSRKGCKRGERCPFAHVRTCEDDAVVPTASTSMPQVPSFPIEPSGATAKFIKEGLEKRQQDMDKLCSAGASQASNSSNDSFLAAQDEWLAGPAVETSSEDFRKACDEWLDEVEPQQNQGNDSLD